MWQFTQVNTDIFQARMCELKVQGVISDTYQRKTFTLRLRTQAHIQTQDKSSERGEKGRERHPGVSKDERTSPQE